MNNKKNKLLLVTFPVDFGNTTWEKLLIEVFREKIDLKVYRFTSNQNRKVNHKKLIGERISCSIGLWREILIARMEGRKILFQGISPALYTYPLLWRADSYIILDWARKLHERYYDTLSSPRWLTLVHRLVLNSQKHLLCVTNPVAQVLEIDYGVPRKKLKKVIYPFSYDLNLFKVSQKRNDQEIRLLFVGGDIYRKGGDVLLQWFLNQENQNLKLTMVTKTPIEINSEVNSSKVDVVKNVEYGQDEHIDLFRNHDIFVLPTKWDSYGSVLGEAACAGLAILTTVNALGAPDVVEDGFNGYICDSQTELLKRLEEVIKDKSFVEFMKINSRKRMETEFCHQKVFKDFVECIF